MYLLVAARAAEPPVTQAPLQHDETAAHAAVVLLVLVLALLHFWPPKPLCLVSIHMNRPSIRAVYTHAQVSSARCSGRSLSALHAPRTSSYRSC